MVQRASSSSPPIATPSCGAATTRSARDHDELVEAVRQAAREERQLTAAEAARAKAPAAGERQGGGEGQGGGAPGGPGAAGTA